MDIQSGRLALSSILVLPMLLRDLAALVNKHPHLGNISFDELCTFVRLSKLTRGHIEKAQQDKSNPPVFLPKHLHEFLGAALSRSFTEIAWYWYAFKEAVWTGTVCTASREDIDIFREHGLPRAIGK